MSDHLIKALREGIEPYEGIAATEQLMDMAAAEIERLRAGLREYACTGTDHPCGCYDQFLSERAEIERLRAERDEWKAKWMSLAAASLVAGTMTLEQKADTDG